MCAIPPQLTLTSILAFRCFLCCPRYLRQKQLDFIAERAESNDRGIKSNPGMYLGTDGKLKYWRVKEVADAELRVQDFESTLYPAVGESTTSNMKAEGDATLDLSNEASSSPTRCSVPRDSHPSSSCSARGEGAREMI